MSKIWTRNSEKIRFFLHFEKFGFEVLVFKNGFSYHLGHHVTVTHSGHRDQCPPQAKGDRAEVVGGVDLDPLGVVDQAGEDHDAQHQEEHQQHQLLGGGAEGLQQDLEAAGVSRQFEEPQDADDGEELEDIRVLDVGDQMLEDEVRVETDGGHKVYDIHRGIEKITSIGAAQESRCKRVR